MVYFSQDWDRRTFAAITAPPEPRPCAARPKNASGAKKSADRGPGDVLLRVERALATRLLDAEGGLLAMIAESQIVSEAEGIVGGAGR